MAIWDGSGTDLGQIWDSLYYDTLLYIIVKAVSRFGTDLAIWDDSGTDLEQIWDSFTTYDILWYLSERIPYFCSFFIFTTIFPYGTLQY